MELDQEFRSEFDREVNAALGIPEPEVTSEESSVAPEAGEPAPEPSKSPEEQVDAEDAVLPAVEESEDKDGDSSSCSEAATAESSASDEENPPPAAATPPGDKLHEVLKEANKMMKCFYVNISDGFYFRRSDQELQTLWAEKKSSVLSMIRERLGGDEAAVERVSSLFKKAHFRKLQVAQRRRHENQVRDDLARKYMGQIVSKFDASWIECKTREQIYTKMKLPENAPVFDPCELVLLKSIGIKRAEFERIVLVDASSPILDFNQVFRNFKADVSRILKDKKFINEEDLKLDEHEEEIFRDLEYTAPKKLEGPLRAVWQELKESFIDQMATKRCNEEVRYVIAIEYASKKFQQVYEDCDSDADHVYAIISTCFDKTGRNLKYAEHLWQWPSKKPEQITKYLAEVQRKPKGLPVPIASMTPSHWDQLLKDYPPEALAQLEAGLARARQNAAASTAAANKEE